MNVKQTIITKIMKNTLTQKTTLTLRHCSALPWLFLWRKSLSLCKHP